VGADKAMARETCLRSPPGPWGITKAWDITPCCSEIQVGEWTIQHSLCWELKTAAGTQDSHVASAKLLESGSSDARICCSEGGVGPCRVTNASRIDDMQGPMQLAHANHICAMPSCSLWQVLSAIDTEQKLVLLAQRCWLVLKHAL